MYVQLESTMEIHITLFAEHETHYHLHQLKSFVLFHVTKSEHYVSNMSSFHFSLLCKFVYPIMILLILEKHSIYWKLLTDAPGNVVFSAVW